MPTVWGNIARGRGVGLVVGSLRYQLPRGVTLVPLAPPAPTLAIDLVWPVDRTTPAVRRLIEAADRLAQDRGWLPRPATLHAGTEPSSTVARPDRPGSPARLRPELVTDRHAGAVDVAISGDVRATGRSPMNKPQVYDLGLVSAPPNWMRTRVSTLRER